MRTASSGQQQSAEPDEGERGLREDVGDETTGAADQGMTRNAEDTLTAVEEERGTEETVAVVEEERGREEEREREERGRKEPVSVVEEEKEDVKMTEKQISYDYEELKSRPEAVNISSDTYLELQYPLHISYIYKVETQTP